MSLCDDLTKAITEELERRYVPNRGTLNESDFVFPETRSFPIMQAQDVGAAVHSWGRYKGNESFDSFKQKLTALAQRKGFSDQLPAGWTDKSVELGKGLFADLIFGDS